MLDPNVQGVQPGGEVKDAENATPASDNTEAENVEGAEAGEEA